MRLTESETKLIEDRRGITRTKQLARALRARLASGEEAPNKILREARALGGREDCNCPSQWDMCWECKHCLETRVRIGQL